MKSLKVWTWFVGMTNPTDDVTLCSPFLQQLRNKNKKEMYVHFPKYYVHVALGGISSPYFGKGTSISLIIFTLMD